jgi:hypothetical protein
MEKSNNYSKYGTVDLQLTFARSDNPRNQSWENIHILLTHYQHEKKAKKFSLELLLKTINHSWDAAHQSDQTVSLTPIVSFYKSCKDNPQSPRQKVDNPHQLILCGTEDATYFPKPELEDARMYKVLQLSVKAWRTQKAYDEIG